MGEGARGLINYAPGLPWLTRKGVFEPWSSIVEGL